MQSISPGGGMILILIFREELLLVVLISVDGITHLKFVSKPFSVTTTTALGSSCVVLMVLLNLLCRT
jgi:hypothetical protein